ncbi:enoyl-CoA hydratase/isomerase family protein [candidate division KSB1 bacterium]|nr:enoyl-CoA hydratase/isomerase family protein [candidate division KSB1 bacterium]
MIHAYRHLKLSGDTHVRRVTLARAEVRNAFNADVISELTSVMVRLKRDEALRAVIIDAEGPTFCAGADFHWMGGMKTASYEANLVDSQCLFEMFLETYRLPIPTIACVQGGAYGGGAGLVACCDFVVMAEDALLSFSEVRIGLVPATISPFVIRKIGEGRARELFLSGALIDAERALRIGLANQAVPVESLVAACGEYVAQLMKAGPQALRLTKEVLREVPGLNLHDAREYTALRIAEQRLSDEGQEGMTAFLEKRKPKWAR